MMKISRTSRTMNRFLITNLYLAINTEICVILKISVLCDYFNVLEITRYFYKLKKKSYFLFFFFKSYFPLGCQFKSSENSLPQDVTKSFF